MLYQFLVYARTGVCLYNRQFIPTLSPSDEAEREKLVFGALFSIKELTKSLAPSHTPSCPLEAITTANTRLHIYESASGFRFIAFTSIDMPPLVDHLQHVFQDIWVEQVTKSPLYSLTNMNVDSTKFDACLSVYLDKIPNAR